MALGIYFSPTSMNTQQYDTCMRKLEAAGAGKPASFGTQQTTAASEARLFGPHVAAYPWYMGG